MDGDWGLIGEGGWSCAWVGPEWDARLLWGWGKSGGKGWEGCMGTTGVKQQGLRVNKELGWQLGFVMEGGGWNGGWEAAEGRNAFGTADCRWVRGVEEKGVTACREGC